MQCPINEMLSAQKIRAASQYYCCKAELDFNLLLRIREKVFQKGFCIKFFGANIGFRDYEVFFNSD